MDERYLIALIFVDRYIALTPLYLFSIWEEGKWQQIFEQCRYPHF
jgi:hypothetical protein